MIKKVRGFTLIEIIIGIVVLSIALTGGLSLLISQVDAYRDPLIKEKSVQIAKRVVHEIQIRAYDEKSDIGGGIFRCSETVGGISLGDCSAKYGTATMVGVLEKPDRLTVVQETPVTLVCPY